MGDAGQPRSPDASLPCAEDKGPAGGFSVRRRLRSFSHAAAGMRVLLATQHNAWIHAAATGLVIAAGVLLRVSRSDWCWLVTAIAAVWTAEALNSAIEFLADEVTLERRGRIRCAKDLGAAAVLCASLGAGVIGTLVFWPHVRVLL